MPFHICSQGHAISGYWELPVLLAVGSADAPLVLLASRGSEVFSMTFTFPEGYVFCDLILSILPDFGLFLCLCRTPKSFNAPGPALKVISRFRVPSVFR